MMVFQSNKKAHDYSELVNEHYFYNLVFIQFHKARKIPLLQILSYFPACSLKMKGNHYFFGRDMNTSCLFRKPKSVQPSSLFTH